MRSKDTFRIALGGLLSAAAVAILFFGSIIPFATFLAPAAASLAVLYFCIEYSRKTALLIYIVIASLSLLLAPDKELALLFAVFLGYYPIAKGLIETLRAKPLKWTLKLALCNATTLSLYWIITHVLVIEAVRDEFAAYTTWVVVALVLLGNATFIIFDIALTRLSMLYLVKFRPKLTRNR